MQPLYPQIKVTLTGQDGNAFVIIGLVRTALRRKGVPVEKVNEFTTEAMSSTYDHVLSTAMRWVDVH